MRFLIVRAVPVTLAVAAVAAVYALPLPAQQRQPVAAPPNVDMPTMGGGYFWSDELVFRDWRIQRNVYTGHYRLLDPYDVRRAWGTFQQCNLRLEEIKVKAKLKPLGPKVVIAMHGLIRSRGVMIPMCKYLQANSDFETVNICYSSTRLSLEENAQALAKVIANLGPVREINFVAHSYGNIVIRRYMADSVKAGRRDPRIKRLVMLAPPNHGSQLANMFKGNAVFGLVWGSGGKAVVNWKDTAPTLIQPFCQFGIIAGGGKGGAAITNPLLSTDNDLVVRVEETALSGANDFTLAPLTHDAFMRSPVSQKQTLHFLLNGQFAASDAAGNNGEATASGAGAIRNRQLPVSSQPRSAAERGGLR